MSACLLYDEIRGERKYGLNTAGFERPLRLRKTDFAATSAYSYMPSNYVLLERLFAKMNEYKHNGSFLDIGCGKGRVLSVAAHFGFTEIKGVELVPEYCTLAEQEILKLSKSFPSTSFTITCADAAEYTIPNNIQCIFFYNPFKEVMIDVLISNILKSYQQSPRSIYILYLNPLFKDNFIKAGFVQIFRASRFAYLKASILYLDAASGVAPMR